jgi:hypothetical protein
MPALVYPIRTYFSTRRACAGCIDVVVNSALELEVAPTVAPDLPAASKVERSLAPALDVVAARER